MKIKTKSRQNHDKTTAKPPQNHIKNTSKTRNKYGTNTEQKTIDNLTKLNFYIITFGTFGSLKKRELLSKT